MFLVNPQFLKMYSVAQSGQHRQAVSVNTECFPSYGPWPLVRGPGSTGLLFQVWGLWGKMCFQAQLWNGAKISLDTIWNWDLTWKERKKKDFLEAMDGIWISCVWCCYIQQYCQAFFFFAGIGRAVGRWESELVLILKRESSGMFHS